MAIVEREVSELLLSLARGIEWSEDVRAILMYVGFDSVKHADLLEKSAKNLVPDAEVNLKECEELVGTESIKLVKRLREKTEEISIDLLTIEKARELIEEQTKIEGDIGEEYLNMCHAKAFSLITKSSLIRKILELISEDEERHIELLKSALEYLSL